MEIIGLSGPQFSEWLGKYIQKYIQIQITSMIIDYFLNLQYP